MKGKIEKFSSSVKVQVVFLACSLLILNSRVLALPRCELDLIETYRFDEASRFSDPDIFNGSNTLPNPNDGSLNFSNYKGDGRWDFSKFYYNSDQGSWVFENKENIFETSFLPAGMAYDYFPLSNIACSIQGFSESNGVVYSQIFFKSLSGLNYSFSADGLDGAFCPQADGKITPAFSESGALLTSIFRNGQYSLVLKGTAGQTSLIPAALGDASLVATALSPDGNFVVFKRRPKNKNFVLGPYLFNATSGTSKKIAYKSIKAFDFHFIGNDETLGGSVFYNARKTVPLIARAGKVKALKAPFSPPGGYVRVFTEIANRINDGRWIVQAVPYRTESFTLPGKTSYLLFDEATNKYCDLQGYLPNYKRARRGYSLFPSSNGNLLVRYKTVGNFSTDISANYVYYQKKN